MACCFKSEAGCRAASKRGRAAHRPSGTQCPRVRRPCATSPPCMQALMPAGPRRTKVSALPTCRRMVRRCPSPLTSRRSIHCTRRTPHCHPSPSTLGQSWVPSRDIPRSRRLGHAPERRPRSNGRAPGPVLGTRRTLLLQATSSSPRPDASWCNRICWPELTQVRRGRHPVESRGSTQLGSACKNAILMHFPQDSL